MSGWGKLLVSAFHRQIKDKPFCVKTEVRALAGGLPSPPGGTLWYRPAFLTGEINSWYYFIVVY